MIKAETISKSPDSAPEWRSTSTKTLTPWRALIIVFVAAVAASAAAIVHNNANPQISTAGSQQPAATSLAVSPLGNNGSLQASPTSVQATPGAGTAASSNGAADALGPQQTPSLNNATTPAQSTNSSITDPNQINTLAP